MSVRLGVGQHTVAGDACLANLAGDAGELLFKSLVPEIWGGTGLRAFSVFLNIYMKPMGEVL